MDGAIVDRTPRGDECLGCDLPTEDGTVLHAGRQPRDDAFVVRALRAAGGAVEVVAESHRAEGVRGRAMLGRGWTVLRTAQGEAGDRRAGDQRRVALHRADGGEGGAAETEARHQDAPRAEPVVPRAEPVDGLQPLPEVPKASPVEQAPPPPPPDEVQKALPVGEG